jgi:Na+/H+-translocating membrane pyrophosphatase
MNSIDIYILTIPISVGLALLISAYLLWYISRQSSGTDKMIRINKAIREGAKAYLKRQYKL